MVRFYDKILNVTAEKVCGRWSTGFCVGGQTIRELTGRIEENMSDVNKKVVLMIGTNDILRNRGVKVIVDDLDDLIEMLKQICEEIVVCTLPPIPKLALNDPRHIEKLGEINRFIRDKASSKKVELLDISNEFIDRDEQSGCKIKYFEKIINVKGEKKQDLVHLNVEGFKVIKRKIDALIDSKKKVVTSMVGFQQSNNIFCEENLSEELLDENNFSSGPREEINQFLPEVEIRIGSLTGGGIVDSGSQATILSEDFYEKIKENVDYEIPELKMSNTSIVGITGARSKKVEKQVQIEVNFGSLTMPVDCLVVKGVQVDFLIGCDFLIKYNAIVDFKERKLNIVFKSRYHRINLKESKDKQVTGSINVVRVNFLNQMTYDNDNECEHQLNEIESVISYESKINEISTKPVVLTIEHKIEQKIKELGQHCEDLNKLREVLMKNKEVFSDMPGCIKDYVAKLNLKVDKPYIGKSYPVPYHKRRAVEEELSKLKAMDVIEVSDSSFSNPLVCVVKKDLSIRTCLDSRKLNTFLTPDRQSTETTEEILQKFMNVKYFTALDLTMGFHQVLLDKDSRKYVAFTFGGKNYQYKRLPFGLNVSTALFTKAMDTIFGPEFSEFVTCYVDDILITSKSYEEHLQHVDKVLNRLKEFGATIKITKTDFLKKEVKFLGYILSDTGIKMDPDKVSKIQNFPEPDNLKKLQAFLGLCNYYRVFQRNYSYLTTQFNHLLSSKGKWYWGSKERNIFNEIKQKFLKAVILNHPNWEEPFFINTDASDISVAAILYQYDEAGEEKVVCFASRAMINAERGYSTTEKELLAVIFACKKFRSYITGHFKVVVRSDHRALSFLKTCRLTNGRLLRWSLVLQEYNLDIEYVKGKENIPADVLSRTAESGHQTGKDMNTIHILKTNIKWGVENREFSKLLKNVGIQQRQDEKLSEIFLRLENNEDDKINNNFMIFNDILFQKRRNNENQFRVCIPEIIKSRLIELSHLKYGHMGGGKIYLCLKEFCTFPAMEKTIKNQLKKCVLCQKAKQVTVKQIGQLKPIVPERVKQLVSVDLIGELPTGAGGVKYIFVLVDIFSKYVKLYSVKRANTKTLLGKIFDKYIPEVGPIEAILSDHGTQFTSDMWYSKLEEANIKAVHASVYHPQSNPTERVNKEINKIIRIYCHKKHTNWPATLEFVEQCLNNSVHGVTEHVPSEVMFGEVNRHFLENIIQFPQNRQLDYPRCIELVREKIRSKAEKRKQKFDSKIRPIKFEIGDKVLVKTHHLSNKFNKKIKKYFLLFTGPYIVNEIKMENAYRLREIDSDRIVGTYNVTQLKKFFE